MKNKLCILLVGMMVLTGCQWVHQWRPSSEHPDLVAEAAGLQLTRADLERITQAAMTPEDSAQIAEEYIRLWCSDAVLYERARRAATPEMAAQVENYRRNLYIHEYESALVNARMSKEIPEDSVRAYYDRHPAMFTLRENILCGALLIVPQGAPELNKLKRWLSNIDKQGDDLERVEKYAYHYSKGYELFLGAWKTENQILLRLPVEMNQLSSKLRTSNLVEVQDTANIYLLQITDKRLIGEQMPLSYARPEIEKILLSQRQTDYLKQQKQQLYNDALRKRKIKRYDEE